MKSMLSILAGFLAAILVITIALCISVNSLVEQYGENYIISENKEMSADAIIIPGARINSDGTPSNSLKHRLDMGYELYEKGFSKKILISGDHSSVDYDEVSVMLDYLIDLGVKPHDIFVDHYGIDTYHTMYRADKVFGVSSAVVVSQHYHNVRAIYIGRQLGMTVFGVDAKDSETLSTAKMKIREYGARLKAFLQAGVIKPVPDRLEEPVSIFSDGTVTHEQ